MTAILVVSVLLRLLAIAWAVWLLVRLRDGRLAGLLSMLLLMALRPVLTLAGAAPGWGAELPALGVSVLSLAAVAVFGRVSREDRAVHRRLRESEERYRALVLATAQQVWMADERGEGGVADQGWWEKLTGQPASASRGGGWVEMLHPDDRERARAIWREALRARKSFNVEYRVRGRGGEYRNVSVRAVPVFEPDGGFREWVGTFSDVTERRRAEAAVRRREKEYETLATMAPVGIFHAVPGRGCTYFNPRACELMGRPAEAALGDRWRDALHPDDRERVLRGADAATREDHPFRAEFRFCRPDGTVAWVLGQAQPQRAGHDEATSWVGTLTDITERKQGEQALREREERLRLLSRRLLEVQEQERRHIARELHDEIGQAFTALRLGLQAVERHCPESVAPAVRDGLAVVDGALRQVRDLSLDLRPSLLDDLGLVPALRWYLDRLGQRAGLNIQLAAERLPQRLPPELETVCFRVVQEALTNVMRHAPGRRVWVEVGREDATVRLRVADDGAGFDVAAAWRRSAAGDSLGLVSMRERVELVGGELEVESAPGRGTEVRARLPLATEKVAVP